MVSGVGGVVSVVGTVVGISVTAAAMGTGVGVARCFWVAPKEKAPNRTITTMTMTMPRATATGSISHFIPITYQMACT